MTTFKLLGAAALVSVAVATPALAQQAAQEPGAQAFYQSLGVGGRDGGTASAMPSLNGSSSYASLPAPSHARTPTKHATDHK
jgi:hypothetical protein